MLILLHKLTLNLPNIRYKSNLYSASTMRIKDASQNYFSLKKNELFVPEYSSIEVYTTTGQLIKKNAERKQSYSIDLGNLSNNSAIFLVRILSGHQSKAIKVSIIK